MEKTLIKFFCPKIFYLLSYSILASIIGISCTGYPTKPENPIGYKILFTDQLDGRNFEIATINEDGSNLQHLTNTPIIEDRPSWSPDGNQILYISESSVGAQVHIMDSNGSNQHRLISIPGYCYNPIWSPDGGKILFRSTFEGHGYLYSVNPDGSDLINLNHYNGLNNFDADWSPDGSKIVFVSEVEDSIQTEEIYIMDRFGEDVQQLTFNSVGDYRPRWSPDGQKIVFISFLIYKANLYIMNSDGSDQHQLTDYLNISGSVVWSPDGNSILYTYMGYFRQIWMMRPDGSRQHSLTYPFGSNYNPNWSPDGRKIVFESTRDDVENQFIYSDIYIMNANGTGQKRLTNSRYSETYPSFSPVPMY